jgi:hypothetical protein
MRPEQKKAMPTAADFVESGVSETWAGHMIPAGFESPEKLKELKPAQIQQALNKYRKKNKLDIPAVQMDEIESWLK